MRNLALLALSTALLSGCHNMTHVHTPEDLSKYELREHLRPYVNNPNYLFGKASLPGNVSYLSMNKLGVTVIEKANSILLILPSDVFFHDNSDELTSHGKIALSSLITVFNSIDNSHIIITGHTDNIGTKAHKGALSTKIAESVKSHLLVNGIEQKRILTYGAADREPVSDDSIRGKALNRRVTIKIRAPKGDTK